MNADTYGRICSLIYEESGIRLKSGKEAMLSARLSRRIHKLGLRSNEEYLEHLERDLRKEVVQLIDLVSTNVTHFFRENEHFEFLGKQYALWLQSGQKRFRFWCAATATGEEPYTIAMTLRDVESRLRLRPDTRLLATDISTRALAHAKRGEYSAARLEGIPANFRSKYLDVNQTDPSEGASMSTELQELISFRRLNLAKPPFKLKGPLDIVFCRNVMFYFDDPVKAALVHEIGRIVRPDGFLIVGKSESIPALRGLFDRVGPAIYKRCTR